MNPFLQALHRVWMQRYGGNPNTVLGARYLQHMATLPEAQNPLVQHALGAMMYGGPTGGSGGTTGYGGS